MTVNHLGSHYASTASMMNSISTIPGSMTSQNNESNTPCIVAY